MTGTSRVFGACGPGYMCMAVQHLWPAAAGQPALASVAWPARSDLTSMLCYPMCLAGPLSEQNIKDRYYGVNDPVSA